jgi:acyl-CoA synthetase (AMP-forming)/AMP-acid ligase II
VLRRGVADEALAEEIKAWCRTRLAGYKCPRGLRFVAALPLSAAGKVLKTQLRAEQAQLNGAA